MENFTLQKLSFEELKSKRSSLAPMLHIVSVAALVGILGMLYSAVAQGLSLFTMGMIVLALGSVFYLYFLSDKGSRIYREMMDRRRV